MPRKPIIVADGDSWCDYPRLLMTGGGLPDHLEGILGVDILNIAHAGDPSEETAGLKSMARLAKVLPGADFLLFSSGGDDIAGDWFPVCLNHNTDGNIAMAINWERLNAKLALIAADYEEVLEIIQQVNPSCVMVSHTYDYPPARVMGLGVKELDITILGPWLQPGFVSKGWVEVGQQQQLTEMILQAFQNMVMKLARNYVGRWIVVPTQTVCAPEDWQNELHLEDSGWKKVAQEVATIMKPYIDALT